MPALLVKSAEDLVSMESWSRELKGAGFCAENGFIKEVGPTGEIPSTANTVFDLFADIRLTGPDSLRAAQMVNG